ncbi:MAG TPA: hypothetical protein VMK12_31310 [Anaeromyxobacteraceae bacterium]|nr:hypothetical protein [Anaeromyxobacteraceae bacterium]
MADLKSLSKLPEVKSAVLCNACGSLLESMGELEGESVAAVIGFLTGAMARAGDHVGLGTLRRIAWTGQAQACLVVVQGDTVTTAFVAPPTALSAVEKVFDAS